MTLRLQVISDLHLSHAPFTFQLAPGADAVVLAGDFGPPAVRHLVERLMRSIPVPVFVVLGNHDLYGTICTSGLSPSADVTEIFTQFPHVHLLDNTCVRFKGHHIVGGTLWTDFNLYGGPIAAMNTCRRGISDFQAIRTHRFYTARSTDGSEDVELETVALVTPLDMVGAHRTARSAFKDVIAAGEPTVVISHFGPSIMSIDPTYDTPFYRPLNPYFTSDCEDLMQPNVKLFIQGHTHRCLDYRINDTRVVCNPRGYGTENPSFNPLFTVEV